MSSHGVYAKIYNRIISDKSSFPPIPDVLIRLRDELHSSHSNVKSFAKLIQIDVGLTGFIIKASSSVYFRTRVPVNSLEDCMSRLGLSETYNIAFAFFTRSLFNSSNYRVVDVLKEINFNSTKIASIGSLLAQNIPWIDPGRAMLAGILQDIGASPILAVLYERKEIFQDVAKRNEALDKLCPLIGTFILKSWDFEEDYMEVVRNRNNWLRDHEGRLDLSDLISIARLHSYMGTRSFKKCPLLIDLPAFTKMPVQELSPNKSLLILEQSKQELKDIQRLLLG